MLGYSKDITEEYLRSERADKGRSFYYNKCASDCHASTHGFCNQHRFPTSLMKRNGSVSCSKKQFCDNLQIRLRPAKWTCRSDRQVSFPGCHVLAFVLHCFNFPLPLSSQSLPLSLLGARGFKAGSAGLLQTDTANKHYCTSPVCLQLSIRGTNQESRRASCHSDTLSLSVCVCMREKKKEKKNDPRESQSVTVYV